MDKRFWGFLAVIALLLTGIFIYTNRGNDNSGMKGTLTNHVIGSGSSGVKLVEYGDYQCPACGQYYPVLKQVQEKYKDVITFQFRNFPLFQIHVNAIAAARAAEAADLQGKFWAMHDKLYENQSIWQTAPNPLSNFQRYAKDIGLDETKFTTDYKSNLVNGRVQADLKEATRLKVESTPTFFLDGKKISSPDATVDSFSKVIDAAISQKQAQKQDSATDKTSTDGTTPSAIDGGPMQRDPPQPAQ